MDEWNKGLMAHLGIRILETTPERVVGELQVRDELKTTTAAVHGGTLMAFADTVGAVGTSALGFKTATLESKTNFLAAAACGTHVTGDCTPIHRGRTTMVWQTRISAENGKLVALVTQTQLVLPAPAPK